MKILAIESSCDETASAVVENGRILHSSVILSQVEEHQLYGGVVPEIASRRHVEGIEQVVSQALTQADTPLEELDGIAVTAGPGLIGALLVGVNFGKALAYQQNLPLIPVHHIRGHIAANYLVYPELTPPFLSLVVSGGHSHIVLVKDYTQFQVVGRTLDDAAGEAFDKAARTLGFPYPGGIYIDEAAKKGNPATYRLPTPRAEGAYNFSFSGLKTAVINLVHNLEQKGEPVIKEDVATTFQEIVVTTLTDKLVAAAKEYKQDTLVCAGGVAANSGLRSRLEQVAQQENLKLFLPPLSLCGDNAAMIGAQAFYEFQDGNVADWSLNATATVNLEQGFSK